MRRPDDLVGAEIDCWFGDVREELATSGAEAPTTDNGTPQVIRKLRDKLTATDPSAK